VLALSDVLPNLVRYLLVEGETRAAHVDGVDVEELAILPDGHGDGVGGMSPTDEAGLGVTHRSVARSMRLRFRILGCHLSVEFAAHAT